MKKRPGLYSDESVLSAFSSWCDLSGQTKSGLVEKLMMECLDNCGMDYESPSPPQLETKGKVSVRFYPEELKSLKESAEKEQLSLPAFIISGAREKAALPSIVNESKLLPVRESNRQIAAIGRNLNQLTKAVNEDKTSLHRLKLEPLEKLTVQLQQHRDMVTEVLLNINQRCDFDGQNMVVDP
jgi:predicted HicB family RNase H-like nuclease